MQSSALSVLHCTTAGALVAQVMASVEDRYKADERVQLDMVADHFVTAFREADLPFNKLLADQALDKVWAGPGVGTGVQCSAPLRRSRALPRRPVRFGGA